MKEAARAACFALVLLATERLPSAIVFLFGRTRIARGGGLSDCALDGVSIPLDETASMAAAAVAAPAAAEAAPLTRWPRG